MATFTSVRTAQKAHRCGTESHACQHRIQPGELYRHWKAAPNDPDIGNTGWISMAECARCSALYGRAIEAVA